MRKNNFKFSQIKAQVFKNLGLKTKSIAKVFALLSNVNVNRFNNENDYMKTLENKLNNLKKLD